MLGSYVVKPVLKLQRFHTIKRNRWGGKTKIPQACLTGEGLALLRPEASFVRAAHRATSQPLDQGEGGGDDARQEAVGIGVLAALYVGLGGVQQLPLQAHLATLPSPTGASVPSPFTGALLVRLELQDLVDGGQLPEEAISSSSWPCQEEDLDLVSCSRRANRDRATQSPVQRLAIHQAPDTFFVSKSLSHESLASLTRTKASAKKLLNDQDLLALGVADGCPTLLVALALALALAVARKSPSR